MNYEEFQKELSECLISLKFFKMLERKEIVDYYIKRTKELLDKGCIDG